MPASVIWHINSLRPRLNRRSFSDDILKCIYVNENLWIPIKISLKFVPKGPIDNIPALVQIMAWCRPGDKPLSEAMMVNLLTNICVTRPQWVKAWWRIYTASLAKVRQTLSQLLNRWWHVVNFTLRNTFGVHCVKKTRTCTIELLH